MGQFLKGFCMKYQICSCNNLLTIFPVGFAPSGCLWRMDWRSIAKSRAKEPAWQLGHNEQPAQGPRYWGWGHVRHRTRKFSTCDWLEGGGGRGGKDDPRFLKGGDVIHRDGDTQREGDLEKHHTPGRGEPHTHMRYVAQTPC